MDVKTRVQPAAKTPPEPINAKYQRVLAAERRATTALEKALVSEERAQEWFEACETHAHQWGEAFVAARAEMQETLAALNAERGQTGTPPPTSGSINLSQILLGEGELALEGGDEDFSTDGLEVDAAEEQQ